MTRKLAGLMLLVFAGGLAVNAGPIGETCALTSGSNTANSLSNGGTPTTTGTFTCTLPTIPAGNILSSLDLIVNDDYSLGTSGSNNEVKFTYSTTNFTGATSLTTEVEGFGDTNPFGVSSTVGNEVSQIGTPTCTQDSERKFDCEEPEGNFTPTTTFTVTGATNWVSGSLQQGGTDAFTIGYTYTTDSTGPEPATLMLTSGGLLGLLLASRRRKKA